MAEAVITIAGGSFTVTISCAVHPLASVATSVYVPALTVIGSVAEFPLRVYVTVPVPPVELKVIEPLVPLHKGSVPVADNVSRSGCITSNWLCAEQPLASVATMVYEPSGAAIGLVATLLFTL